MKKTILSFGIIGLLNCSIVAQTFSLFPTNNATSTSSRGPNPANKAQITCSNYAAADFAGAIPTGAQIVFVGWYLQGTGAATAAVNGNLKVYLENTSDVLYAKTSTTWTAITAPMTACYTGTVSIPITSVALPYGVNVTPFNYTGGGLYLAYEYTNAGTLGVNSHTYAAYSAPTGTLQTKGATSITSSTLPVSVVATASLFKACLVLGYQITGEDPGITYVTLDGTNQKVGTGVTPVTIGLKNVGSLNVAASSYSILINNGASIQTITATPAINSSTTTVLSYTLPTPTLVGLNNYTVTLNSATDVYAGDNTAFGKRFFFDNKSVFMEDFNDTAKWKNIRVLGAPTSTLNAAVIPAGFSVINNDGGGTVGPYFIGSAANNPYFEGQSLSDNFSAANVNKIDDWLVTSLISGYCSTNTDSLVFYLKGTSTVFTDSMEIVLSPTGGATTGSFTISVAYVAAPVSAWTRFAYKLSSVMPIGTTNYRLAFRYKHGDGGSGAFSNYISFDSPHVVRYSLNPMTVNAGVDQVIASTLATLTGVITGTGTTTTWVQTSGPPATITNSTSLSTGVTLTSTGIYCFSLTVTDGCNVLSDEVCINSSIPTGITTADLELISVNPNPAKDLIYLNVTSIKGTEIEITITTIDGRIVFSSFAIADDKMLISLGNLNSGIYFINVNGKNFKQMTKLIKE